MSDAQSHINVNTEDVVNEFKTVIRRSCLCDVQNAAFYGFIQIWHKTLGCSLGCDDFFFPTRQKAPAVLETKVTKFKAN